MTAARRLDSPVTPMVATIPLTIGFVIWRWTDAGRHRLSNFVLAGSRYVSRTQAPSGLFVRRGGGYDGQFYYRLALDPFDLNRTAMGIRLDSISRVERLGYPVLAWLLALGQHSHIPFTLVAINVLAAAVLGLAGGLVAKSAGRHALWGVVFPLYWGYLWTLGRDLTELTTAALVMLGVAALLRHRPLWAGLAFTGAIVSKETAVLLVGTLGVATLWQRVRVEPVTIPVLNPSSSGVARALWPQRSDVAWLMPLVGFVIWQIALLGATGKLPIYKSGNENIGTPLLGMAHGLSHYGSVFPSTASALWFGELALLLIAIVAACRLGRHAPFELRTMWAVAVVLGACAATGIWLGDVGFRSLDDIYLFSWVVLFFHRGRLTPLVAACGATWIVVAIELIRYI